MQFKNPEILIFLFLLLIPVLIHLFQLQRFKKEAFTNVKFLKEIQLETRKSAKLKKLLILITRLLALAALILAFAQPFIIKNSGLQKRKQIVYFDNSLSLQNKAALGIDQLQLHKNILLDKLDQLDEDIWFINNEKSIAQMDLQSLRKELIQLDFHPINKDINQILLQINNRINNETETLFDIFLISDFQLINNVLDTSLILSDHIYNLVNISHKNAENISIDSVWVSAFDTDQISLKARLKSWGMDMEDLSVSLFLNDALYGKTTTDLKPGISNEIEFLIPASGALQGRISLNDHRLNFDNEMYFSIPERPKVKVLIIGGENQFFSRIYQKNEFDLDQFSYSTLDQSIIPEQELIIINELEQIPNPLRQSLLAFIEKKGNVVIIPSATADLYSYNKLFSVLKTGTITGKFKEGKRVNQINYEHPFFDNVFEKEVFNFQYPVISEGFTSNFGNRDALLQFEDRTDFIAEINYGENKVFWIASPLSDTQNDFVDSPLIVPVFYNFSIQNKNEKAIYQVIGHINEISVEVDTSGDTPLKISKNDQEFIPVQLKSNDRIKITTETFPAASGIYDLTLKGDLIQRLAYNYDRGESDLSYSDLEPLAERYDNIHLYNSLDKALKEGNERNNNKELWQLFIIFALVFLILEILLQKFLKN